MADTVQGNDGAQIPLESLARTIVYTGAFVSSISVIYAGKTYVQTLGNDGVNTTSISGWVAQ